MDSETILKSSGSSILWEFGELDISLSSVVRYLQDLVESSGVVELHLMLQKYRKNLDLHKYIRKRKFESKIL